MNGSEPTPGKGSLQIVVVSGLSGAGKSTAIRVLEDLGFYCIDNLPVILIQRFLELCEQAKESINRIVLGVDLRERQFFSEAPRVLRQLREAGYPIEVLFLDASDEFLLRRFSETRRPHPSAAGGGPAEGIRRERELLTPLREQADRILDTSALTVHQLRDELCRWYRDRSAGDGLSVVLLSFGYKFGIPSDADVVLDARCLANPFFRDELRPKTGRDPEVVSFVLERPETLEFLRRVEEFLAFALPLYRREGKTYLTVAIGCTGGRHRSVALIDRLGESLRAHGQSRVQVQHRDVAR